MGGRLSIHRAYKDSCAENPWGERFRTKHFLMTLGQRKIFFYLKEEKKETEKDGTHMDI